MKRITKVGLPLTALAIVGAFAMVVATTNITPAAAQAEPREGSLDVVRGIVERGLSVVENPGQILETGISAVQDPTQIVENPEQVLGILLGETEK